MELLTRADSSGIHRANAIFAGLGSCDPVHPNKRVLRLLVLELEILVDRVNLHVILCMNANQAFG